MPPSVARRRLSEGNRHGNEEQTDSPAQLSVSETLLHKGHDIGGDNFPPGRRRACPGRTKLSSFMNRLGSDSETLQGLRAAHAAGAAILVRRTARSRRKRPCRSGRIAKASVNDSTAGRGVVGRISAATSGKPRRIGTLM